MIPNETNVIGNLWSASRCPKLFKDPENFNPENFLDDNGNYQSIKGASAFGVGKRNCVAENLARLEIFLCFAMVLQKFTFRVPDGDAFQVKIHEGLVRMIGGYEVSAFPRNG